MAAAEEDGRRFQARVDVEGSGRAQVATGVPILDHLLGLLAALSADGQSTIGAAHQIDKGYERIDERLRALGASIERVG